jgi:hypothetical protein
LNTFALSHFCENARWALDYKRFSYAEESWAPMLHMLRTWRLKKTTRRFSALTGESFNIALRFVPTSRNAFRNSD